MTRAGRFSLAGEATAPALVLADPLSFWGGVDVATGAIVDRAHPDAGRVIAGLILVMPGGRGSSSSASVLAEGIRRGTGPAGILLGRPDPILTIGAIVAHTLYGLYCPIVVCALDGLASGDEVAIRRAAGGAAEIRVGPLGR